MKCILTVMIWEQQNTSEATNEMCGKTKASRLDETPLRFRLDSACALLPHRTQVAYEIALFRRGSQ